MKEGVEYTGFEKAKELFLKNTGDSARFVRGVKKILNKDEEDKDTVVMVDPDSEEWENVDKGEP